MESIRFLALNRAALLVKPKQPFFDWANSTEGPKLDPTEPAYDPPVYLVEDVDLSPDPEPAIRRHYRTIFEQELASWHMDQDTWPPNRDLSTFNEWFDVELRSLVIDLPRSPIQVEELGA
jgi:hypothetical protein